jgi:hypothetical protein
LVLAAAAAAGRGWWYDDEGGVNSGERRYDGDGGAAAGVAAGVALAAASCACAEGQLLSLTLPSPLLNGVKGFTTTVALFGSAEVALALAGSILTLFAFLSSSSPRIFSTFIVSQILLCPAVLSPCAPGIHPPVSVRPSRPKFSLPAPTVSLIRLPPPRLEVNCARSLSERDSRQDVLFPKRFSARWWPVEEELKGSKMDLVGLAARGAVVLVDDGIVFGGSAGMVVGGSFDPLGKNPILDKIPTRLVSKDLVMA